jgi:RNA polymerase sigma factor (TIGR02999 family)
MRQMLPVTPTALGPGQGANELSSSLSFLFAAAERGDKSISDDLFSALYSELHRLARCQLAHQVPMTIGATTLLHQAYIEMAGRSSAVFPDRSRFMAYAARVMRGLIIDHARTRSAQKRGGQFHITSWDSVVEQPADYSELEELGTALDQLAEVDPSLAEVVDMKFFCGFTFTEIAAMKNLSERTVQRQWEKARIYLHRKLNRELEG